MKKLITFCIVSSSLLAIGKDNEAIVYCQRFNADNIMQYSQKPDIFSE